MFFLSIKVVDTVQVKLSISPRLALFFFPWPFSRTALRLRPSPTVSPSRARVRVIVFTALRESPVGRRTFVKIMCAFWNRYVFFAFHSHHHSSSSAFLTDQHADAAKRWVRPVASASAGCARSIFCNIAFSFLPLLIAHVFLPIFLRPSAAVSRTLASVCHQRQSILHDWTGGDCSLWLQTDETLPL